MQWISLNMKARTLERTLALTLLGAFCLFAEESKPASGPELRFCMYAPAKYSRYDAAFMSLLEHVARNVKGHVISAPVKLDSLEDKRLFDSPFLFIDASNGIDWNLSFQARENLKKYLENGGFIHIDGGITAAFLRDQPGMAAHHSYAEWEAAPEVKQCFEKILPGKPFIPLQREDDLFHIFYDGLPDPSLLPDTVRDYVVNEKWPDGTYSAVAIRLNGRIAVLCTPVIAMGWERNTLGQWRTNIQFRVLESTENLGSLLQNAAYSGARFQVAREDGGKDTLYCQENAKPAWCQEPSGKWRVFRYYTSREISDFAHAFYTRLGTNIIVYSLTE